MSTASRLFLSVIFVLTVILSSNCLADEEHEVWAFVGDSHTDGFVWPTVMLESLASAGIPLPRVLNAAANGATSRWMLSRLQQDVLAYRPDRVFILAGVNDVAHQQLDEVANNLTRMINEIRQTGADCILMQVPHVGDGWPTMLNHQITGVAQKLDVPLAMTAQAIRRVVESGNDPYGEDGLHCTLVGHVAIARAALDAIGLAHVPVDARYQGHPHPGIVTNWMIRGLSTIPNATRLESFIRSANESWFTLALPVEEENGSWWKDGLRRQGYAMNLAQIAGKHAFYLAKAQLESRESDQERWLNTGGGLAGVWLNGNPVYQRQPGNPAFHAGRERIPVKLRLGRNDLWIAVDGDNFFFSVTYQPVWYPWQKNRTRTD